jgi:hypothetical protein
LKIQLQAVPVSREIARGKPAGLARIRYLLTDRILVAVFDHRQQLAGFDDEMLLGVEKRSTARIRTRPGQVARPISLAF